MDGGLTRRAREEGAGADGTVRARRTWCRGDAQTGAVAASWAADAFGRLGYAGARVRASSTGHGAETSSTGRAAAEGSNAGGAAAEARAMPEGGISLDQRAAEFVGSRTRFPSLTIGSADGLHGGCQMSWTRTGTRVPPISGPRELFHALFVFVPDLFLIFLEILFLIFIL